MQPAACITSQGRIGCLGCRSTPCSSLSPCASTRHCAFTSRTAPSAKPPSWLSPVSSTWTDTLRALSAFTACVRRSMIAGSVSERMMMRGCASLITKFTKVVTQYLCAVPFAGNASANVTLVMLSRATRMGQGDSDGSSTRLSRYP
eukprot:4033975-Amphidinium_carterae.2